MKKEITFPDDALTQNIIALLTVCSMNEREKKLWLDVLPDMKLEDKEELKHNLQEQVEYETGLAGDAVKDFMMVMNISADTADKS